MHCAPAFGWLLPDVIAKTEPKSHRKSGESGQESVKKTGIERVWGHHVVLRGLSTEGLLRTTAPDEHGDAREA
jgi:hypothetical protein